MPQDSASPSTTSLAACLIEALRASGVKRIFGIPGGGSSLEVIEAAQASGIDFILTRTEAAAAIMASITGEMTETPGVVLTGIGPGASSVVNGVAYAHLEKAPLVILTDGPASSPHQAFDQNALFAPVSKLQGRLTPEKGAELARLGIDTALTHPMGPVHFDMTAGDARAKAVPAQGKAPAESPVPEPAKADLARASELVSNAKRPVIIAGLEARYGGAPASLKALAESMACPVLLTYKAKGILPDSHPLTAGLFTGAIAESDLLRAADLIITFGLDRIEMIPGKWAYEAPILELTSVSGTDMPAEPACRLYGSLASLGNALANGISPSAWTSDEIATHAQTIRDRTVLRGTGHTAQTVTQALTALAPEGTRLTVDAGAHMFATLGFWEASEPFGALKSNGLSTMGYALPAAIASALHEPERKTVAVSGDGGMMMCLGELRTAIEHDCDITLVIVNDSALSLIDIKQQRSQYASEGVRYPHADFAGCATALGCASWRVDTDAPLEPALKEALAHKGMSVVEVVCDPDGYGDQLVALRG